LQRIDADGVLAKPGMHGLILEKEWRQS
jgi:hypothetical protein